MKSGGRKEGWKNADSLPYLILNQIDQPGAYLDLKSGNLFRVPPDGLKIGNGSVILIKSEGKVRVCKLSDDPYISDERAKTIAARNKLRTSF